MTEATAASDEFVAEAEAVEEESQARGFRGVADPIDRDEYALTSGPESPGLERQMEARIEMLQTEFDELHERASERVKGAKAKRTERKTARSEARSSRASGGDE